MIVKPPETGGEKYFPTSFFCEPGSGISRPAPVGPWALAHPRQPAWPRPFPGSLRRSRNRCRSSTLHPTQTANSSWLIHTFARSLLISLGPGRPFRHRYSL